MTLSALRASQGELFAFIPDLDSNATAQVLPSCEAVAGRPDHPPTIGPAGADWFIRDPLTGLPV